MMNQRPRARCLQPPFTATLALVLFSPLPPAQAAVALLDCAPSPENSNPTVMLPKDSKGSEDRHLTGDDGKLKDDALLGKVTLIDFWEDWCPWCIKLMPHIVELQTNYGDKGLQAVGVTSAPKGTADEMKSRAAMDANHVNYPTLNLDADSLSRLAGTIPVEFLPYVLLVDRSGRVRYKGHPNEIPEGLVDQLLSEKQDPSESRKCADAGWPVLTRPQDGASQSTDQANDSQKPIKGGIPPSDAPKNPTPVQSSGGSVPAK